MAGNSEDYATIDNAVALDDDYEDTSCTLTPTAIPAGWRLAEWDANVAFVSVVSEFGGACYKGQQPWKVANVYNHGNGHTFASHDSTPPKIGEVDILYVICVRFNLKGFSRCFSSTQSLTMESLAKFDTGCLVFDEGNAVNTGDGLQVR